MDGRVVFMCCVDVESLDVVCDLFLYLITEMCLNG